MSSEALYIAQSDVVDCDIGGDRALLHLDTNTYFTMNATASMLWLALSEPRSLEDLVNLVTENFEVTAEQCRADITTLVDQMLAAKVIGTTTAGAR